jgi:hypothetical protein
MVILVLNVDPILLRWSELLLVLIVLDVRIVILLLEIVSLVLLGSFYPVLFVRLVLPIRLMLLELRLVRHVPDVYHALQLLEIV